MFSEVWAEDLKAYWESLDGLKWDGDSAVSDEVGGDGEDVGEELGEWVFAGEAHFGGCFWGDGGEDGVDFLEGLFEVLAEEGADFLRAEVVGVVVAGGEDVGAEDDATFDFWAEAVFAAAFVEVEHVGGVFGSIAVADSVEA